MSKQQNPAALVAAHPLSTAVSSLISQPDQDPAHLGLDMFDTSAPRTTKHVPITNNTEVINSSAVDPAAHLAVGADKIEFWAPRIKGSLVDTVASIVEVGSLLLKAKAALPHGSYEKMFEAGLGFGSRKGRNYTRIAKNQVLANRHNYAVLPRSIVQLTNLARLHDDDLQEILTEVRARVDQGEKINIDSPKFWAGYRAQYALKAVAAQAPEPLQAPLSADPDQELPPAQGAYSGDSEEAEGGMGETTVGQSGAEVPLDVDAIAESMPDAEGTGDVSPDMAVSAAQASEFTVVPEGNQVNDEVIAQPQAANDQGWDATLPANLGASVEPVDLPPEDTPHLTPQAEAPVAPAIAATADPAVTTVLAEELPQPEDSEVTAGGDESVPQSASNIFPIAGHTPAPLVPADLTPTERDVAKHLFDLWDANIEEAWNDCPLKVRSFFLGWKLKDMEVDANEERKAA